MPRSVSTATQEVLTTDKKKKKRHRQRYHGTSAVVVQTSRVNLTVNSTDRIHLLHTDNAAPPFAAAVPNARPDS